ncbi:MAG: hypothetical protein ABIY58_01005, partial [Acidimicrobiales bacterium]
MTRGPDLAMWEPAAPNGQRLLVAAPLIGDWVPSMRINPLLAVLFGGVVGGTQGLIQSVLGSGTVLIVYAVALAFLFGWRLRWRRHHARPSGMAAILGSSRKRAPVLLVTDAAVLLTETVGPSLRIHRFRPAGVGRPIPGLVA